MFLKSFFYLAAAGSLLSTNITLAQNTVPQFPSNIAPPVHAEVSPPEGTPATPSPANLVYPTEKFIDGPETRLASPIIPGQKYDPGDVSQVTVLYGAWNVVCVAVKSTHQRACRIEQGVKTEGNGDILVRLETTLDRVPVAVIVTPTDIDRKAGIKLVMNAEQAQPGKTDLVTKEIPFEWCNGQICRAVIPFSSSLMTGFFNSKIAVVMFKRKEWVGGGIINQDLRAAMGAFGLKEAQPPEAADLHTNMTPATNTPALSPAPKAPDRVKLKGK